MRPRACASVRQRVVLLGRRLLKLADELELEIVPFNFQEAGARDSRKLVPSFGALRARVTWFMGISRNPSTQWKMNMFSF